MTDLMHTHGLTGEMGPLRETPATRHLCTVVVFMVLLIALIGGGIFGVWRLTVDYSDSLGRWFLAFASLYSLISFTYFLWKTGTKAFEKGEPHIDRLMLRVLRILDAFFANRSWCTRRLRDRAPEVPRTALPDDPSHTAARPETSSRWGAET